MRELRWYGWGYANKTYPLDRRPEAWSFLCSELGLSGEERLAPCSIDTIQLREPRLIAKDMSGLVALIGADGMRSDIQSRVSHSYGKGYRDLVRLRRGNVSSPPDAIVYPRSEQRTLFGSAPNGTLLSSVSGADRASSAAWRWAALVPRLPSNSLD